MTLSRYQIEALLDLVVLEIKMKPVMLVDMDDVLEDLTTAWTSAIHERYGYY